MGNGKTFWALAVSGVFIFSGQAVLAGGGHDHDGHDHGEEQKGPHGGEIQEVGDKEDTHAEIVHDSGAGKVILYLLGKDQKAPAAIKDTPKINLKTKDGNKQIEMKAVGAKDGKTSQFEAVDEVLKADPLDGRIAITLGDGKRYNVKLNAHHGHD